MQGDRILIVCPRQESAEALQRAVDRDKIKCIPWGAILAGERFAHIFVIRYAPPSVREAEMMDIFLREFLPTKLADATGTITFL